MFFTHPRSPESFPVSATTRRSPVSTSSPRFTLANPPPVLSQVVGPRATEDDFLLLSSDDIPFRVATQTLVRASPTFLTASTLASNGTRRIKFSSTSPFPANASVLERFVELLTTHGLSTTTLLRLNVATAVGLVHFLQHYECASLLRTALGCLRTGVRTGSVKSWVAFMAACTALDVGFVAYMLDEPCGGWKREPGFGESVADDLTLDIDIRGYPFEWYAMLPPIYAYAVTKAITYAEKYPTSPRRRGDVFRELVLGKK